MSSKMTVGPHPEVHQLPQKGLQAAPGNMDAAIDLPLEVLIRMQKKQLQGKKPQTPAKGAATKGVAKGTAGNMTKKATKGSRIAGKLAQPPVSVGSVKKKLQAAKRAHTKQTKAAATAQRRGLDTSQASHSTPQARQQPGSAVSKAKMSVARRRTAAQPGQRPVKLTKKATLAAPVARAMSQPKKAKQPPRPQQKQLEIQILNSRAQQQQQLLAKATLKQQTRKESRVVAQRADHSRIAHAGRAALFNTRRGIVSSPATPRAPTQNYRSVTVTTVHPSAAVVTAGLRGRGGARGGRGRGGARGGRGRGGARVMLQ